MTPDPLPLTQSPRLSSLDALRGLTLFFLVGLGPVVTTFCEGVPDAASNGFITTLARLFSHEEWEGLMPWDMLMPLFMFMSCASIPFSMARFRREHDYGAYARRVTRRVILLWLIGMLVQGSVRDLNPDHIYLYTNTLQSIAVAYTVASLLFMFGRVRTQIITFVLLLLAYWGAMEFISVAGFGGGQYGPDNNLAEWIDRTVLGRFRDGATPLPDGSVQFLPGYTYTWLISSLTFAATGLAGLFCGSICKAAALSPRNKARRLLYVGLALFAAGMLWSLEMPIIKHIWTSSMCLVAAGVSFLLMALLFWFYDVRSHTFGLDFLRTYGLNSIMAYIFEEMLNFKSIPHSLFYGLEQYIGGFYPCVLALGQAVVIYLILLAMKRLGIFIRL